LSDFYRWCGICIFPQLVSLPSFRVSFKENAMRTVVGIALLVIGMLLGASAASTMMGQGPPASEEERMNQIGQLIGSVLVAVVPAGIGIYLLATTGRKAETRMA
jgi:hypothetical protein